MNVTTSFIFILFILTGLIIGLTPYVGRKGIEFGVSIPDTEETHLKIAKWKRLYFSINMIGGFILSLPLIALVKRGNTHQIQREASIYVTVGMVIIILISILSYLYIRQQLSKLKKQIPQNTKINQKEIVIELTTRNHKIGIPNSILLLSNGIIIITTAIITWLNYNKIPEKFPVHWGINFIADRFAIKSISTVFALIGFQVILTLVFYMSNYSLIHAKQSLDPKKPVQSSFKNKAYRRAWSRFILILSISTQLLMSLIQLVSVIFYTNHTEWVTYIIILYTVIILIYTIVLSIKYGQSGSRYKEDEYFDKSQVGAHRYEDDTFWKFGIFYYNSEDPSIWIEKIFGIGQTLNMARWQSWAILIGIIFLVCLPLVFL